MLGPRASDLQEGAERGGRGGGETPPRDHAGIVRGRERTPGRAGLPSGRVGKATAHHSALHTGSPLIAQLQLADVSIK